MNVKSIYYNHIHITKMFDNSLFDKFDSEKMHEVYDKWPEISEEAYNSNYDLIHYCNISHIVFAGMGGSGAISDIFYSVLSKAKIHVTVVKGYLLPNTVDENTLVVTISISGNTKETLTVLDSARKLNCKIVSFCSGGEMLEYCKKYGIKYRKIPMIHSPRASFTLFLYAMLKVLEPVLPINREKIKESIENMKQLRDKISSSNTTNNPSLDLANWISGIPLIYYPWGLQAAAIRFKNSLQENSKCHVISEDMIEACHNGIVGWEKSSYVQPILIEGADDYFKTKQRWIILKKLFVSKKIDFKEIKSVNGGVLSKIINLIYLLDYCSIYLALIRGIDPSPVDSIDFIKKQL